MQYADHVRAGIAVIVISSELCTGHVSDSYRWPCVVHRYYKAAKLAAALEKDFHYTVDEKQKSVLLTEEGYEAAEDVLEVWDCEGHVQQS